MLGWWYSQGWLQNLQTIERRLKTVANVFAVKVLLRTWFSPWKQIYTQSTFTTFFKILLDNTISRCIGAIVRGSILFAALLISIGIITIGLLSLIVWPFIPLLIIVFPLLAASGKTF